MPDRETTYTEADVQLVAKALYRTLADAETSTTDDARDVLGALLKAGWLPPSASHGLCGHMGPGVFTGVLPYSCDLLAGHRGMHGCWNPDGKTRCHWWSCKCPEVTTLGAVEPQTTLGALGRCPVHDLPPGSASEGGTDG
jgi:hypothetical protein